MLLVQGYSIERWLYLQGDAVCFKTMSYNVPLFCCRFNKNSIQFAMSLANVLLLNACVVYFVVYNSLKVEKAITSVRS